MADLYVPCEVCGGRRYNRETLEVRYRGKNIADVLDMTVEEALHFFEHHARLLPKLQTLFDVGLGYMRLGQSSTTLSGGEAQRVKLATELSRRATGKTIILLDEPTTGLHMDDVGRLIKVLQQLTDAGNSVLVIEHNLDVLKTADYIIDLGPEGGDAGGIDRGAGHPGRDRGGGRELYRAIPEEGRGQAGGCMRTGPRHILKRWQRSSPPPFTGRAGCLPQGSLWLITSRALQIRG